MISVSKILEAFQFIADYCKRTDLLVLLYPLRCGHSIGYHIKIAVSTICFLTGVVYIEQVTFAPCTAWATPWVFSALRFCLFYQRQQSARLWIRFSVYGFNFCFFICKLFSLDCALAAPRWPNECRYMEVIESVAHINTVITKGVRHRMVSAFCYFVVWWVIVS